MGIDLRCPHCDHRFQVALHITASRTSRKCVICKSSFLAVPSSLKKTCSNRCREKLTEEQEALKREAQSQKDSRIFKMYADGSSFKDIGKVLGVSGGRVGQRIARALREMRHPCYVDPRTYLEYEIKRGSGAIEIRWSDKDNRIVSQLPPDQWMLSTPKSRGKLLRKYQTRIEPHERTD